jgi:uncharacterized protein (DUF3820 family)
MAHRLVKGDVKGLRGKAPVEVVQVLGRTLYLLQETPTVFGARGIASLANAVSKLQYRWEGDKALHVVVLEELGKWVVNRKDDMGDFNGFDIANFINGFAKVGFNPGGKVLRMVRAACLELDPETFAPQGLANVANGFAKLGIYPGKELMDLISKECVRRKLEGFNPQDIANIANAFAKLGVHSCEALLDLISKECLGRGLEGFDPQAIANIANAFAKLDFHPGETLMDMIAKECVRRRLEGFNPQNIANIANAFAKLGVPPGQVLLELISRECVRRKLQGFDPQHIANIANAFAKLDTHPGKALLDLISKECIRRKLEGFDPQHIGNIMNALAAFRHHPGEELLGMVLERCQTLWKRFNGQNLSNVLHGLAILRGVPDGEWMAGFYRRCEEVGWKGFNNQDLRLILWACVVLEVRVDKGLVEALTARLRTFKASVDQGTKSLDYQDALMTCRAVRQALFLLDLTREEGLQELSEAAEAVWGVVKGRDKPPTESKLQQGVLATLKASYGTVESEVWVVEGLLSLDAVISLPCGSKVGVEVDGPPHFFRNRADVPTGETLIKWRMLEKGVELGLLQGWVSVQNGSAGELAKVAEAVSRVRGGTV